MITAERYAQSLEKIRAAAQAAGRSLDGFVPAHLTFITTGRDYETARDTWVKRLSLRYNQDFGPLAGRYGVIGTSEQCAEQLERFRAAGCRYFVLSTTCETSADRDMLEQIAAEVLPRLRG